MKIIRKSRRIIQKILITTSLFVLYIVGFGITLFFVTIFNRRLLRIKRKEAGTFWQKAEGYEADIQEFIRQS